MKLLFDQNLSPRLVERLDSIYPDSLHVQSVGLDFSSDSEVWNYARIHDCIICTKDSDFHESSLLLGCPPKVIWIRRGNCSTREIEEILVRHVKEIHDLSQNEEIAFLMLV
ncbi:MAG: DUF5615 family PIN-like protein [Burkholderiales bacterium]